jgi:hypothetical protein
VYITSIDLVYTWESVDHSYYNTAAPINAGKYMLRISGTGIGMIVEDFEIDDITISKRTVTGVSQTIAVGETSAPFTATITDEVASQRKNRSLQHARQAYIQRKS